MTGARQRLLFPMFEPAKNQASEMLIKITIKRNVFPIEKVIYKQYILLIGGLETNEILRRANC